MKILICAATAFEFKACCAVGPGVSVICTGMGPERARASLESYLRYCGNDVPDLIISSGFAGSLSDTLQPGDWVCTQSDFPFLIAPVKGCEVEFISSPDLVDNRYGSAFIATAGSHKKPLAVDMESDSLGEVCKKRGIPFLGLRVISDSPQKPFPDFLRFFISSGSYNQRFISLIKGLGCIIKVPSGIPHLIQMSFHARKALKSGWLNIGKELRTRA